MENQEFVEGQQFNSVDVETFSFDSPSDLISFNQISVPEDDAQFVENHQELVEPNAENPYDDVIYVDSNLRQSGISSILQQQELNKACDNDVIYIDTIDGRNNQINRSQEEPLDLSCSKLPGLMGQIPSQQLPKNSQNYASGLTFQHQMLPPQPKMFHPMMLQNRMSLLANHPQVIQRQQEVMKMARSVFFKRTRTLYHWMYPQAPRPLVKQVVTAIWDGMGAEEKNIYIAQAMGRCCSKNGNAIINPQLGKMRELPQFPLVGKHMNRRAIPNQAMELQNAISSISSDKGENSLMEPPRKKSKFSKSTSLEFENDPELSRELAQFNRLQKQA